LTLTIKKRMHLQFLQNYIFYVIL